MHDPSKERTVDCSINELCDSSSKSTNNHQTAVDSGSTEDNVSSTLSAIDNKRSDAINDTNVSFDPDIASIKKKQPAGEEVTQMLVDSTVTTIEEKESVDDGLSDKEYRIVCEEVKDDIVEEENHLG